MLYRGDYPLPHQCQLIQRDLDAEKITRAVEAGQVKAMGYRLTEKQLADQVSVYTYLIYTPASAGMNWCAFRTRERLQTWLDAYGAALDIEPGPGDRFWVLLPENGEEAFAELRDNGVTYDPRRTY